VVKWQDTQGLQNEGIRLKLVFEKCDRESEGSLVLCDLLKFFKQAFHIWKLNQKRGKGSSLYSVNNAVAW